MRNVKFLLLARFVARDIDQDMLDHFCPTGKEHLLVSYKDDLGPYLECERKRCGYVRRQGRLLKRI